MKIHPILWQAKKPIVLCFTTGLLLAMSGVGPEWLPVVVTFGGALTVVIVALVVERVVAAKAARR
jgi:hypothetical protein